MTALIIYSSQFGNTEKIARAIGEGISSFEKVEVLPVAEAKVLDWNTIHILVVGSPTQGGRATKDLQDFLDAIPADALKNTKVAAFDTRFAEKDHGFGLRLLMRVIKYAAGKIAETLEQKGGQLVGPVEGFIVSKKEGPLAEGELERAKAWGKMITEKL